MSRTAVSIYYMIMISSKTINIVIDIVIQKFKKLWLSGNIFEISIDRH